MLYKASPQQDAVCTVTYSAHMMCIRVTHFLACRHLLSNILPVQTQESCSMQQPSTSFAALSGNAFTFPQVGAADPAVAPVPHWQA